MIQAKKMVRYNACILVKTNYILEKLSESDYSIMDLYQSSQVYFDDFNEYLLTLDALFVLGKLRYDYQNQKLHYKESM